MQSDLAVKDTDLSAAQAALEAARSEAAALEAERQARLRLEAQLQRLQANLAAKSGELTAAQDTYETRT